MVNPFLRQSASLHGSSAITADNFRHAERPEIYLQFQVISERDGKMKDASKVAVLSYVLRSMDHRPNLSDRFSSYVLVNQCSEIEKSLRQTEKTNTHHVPHHHHEKALKLKEIQEHDDVGSEGVRVLGRHDHAVVCEIEQETKEETLDEFFDQEYEVELRDQRPEEEQNSFDSKYQELGSENESSTCSSSSRRTNRLPRSRSSERRRASSREPGVKQSLRRPSGADTSLSFHVPEEEGRSISRRRATGYRRSDSTGSNKSMRNATRSSRTRGVDMLSKSDHDCSSTERRICHRQSLDARNCHGVGHRGHRTRVSDPLSRSDHGAVGHHRRQQSRWTAASDINPSNCDTTEKLCRPRLRRSLSPRPQKTSRSEMLNSRYQHGWSRAAPRRSKSHHHASDNNSKGQSRTATQDSNHARLTSSKCDLALVAAGNLKDVVANLTAQVRAHEKSEQDLMSEVNALRNSLTARRKILAGTVSNHRSQSARVCLGDKAIESHIMVTGGGGSHRRAAALPSHQVVAKHSSPCTRAV